MILVYRYRVKSLNGLLRSRKSTKAVRPSPVRRAGRKAARRGRKVSRD
ncbi:hypothetical protein OH687_12410 [Burkholderia anthina]|nr:hypothetical protein OH687_12410 [Burkholderia anthina]